MDINKILFEQLNLQGVQTSFTADDTNILDGKKDVPEEINKINEEISSAIDIKDDTSLINIEDKKTKSNSLANMLNVQILTNILSTQSQFYNNSVENTEKEIQDKTEEYEKLAQEIAEKQEEYEKIMSEAEVSSDESVIENANSIGNEINSMVSSLESIKKSISNLETTLVSKQNIANTFNSQLNALSKVQTKLSKEASAVNASSAANSVNKNSSAASSKSTETADTTSNWKVSDRIKDEFEGLKGEPHHSFHSLNEIIGGHCQDTAWESNAFYDAYKTKSFKELNSIPDEVDIDGDGQVSADEKYYMKNYKLVAYSALVGLPTNRNSLERNTIEEQIERLEFLENNPEIAEITQALVDVCKNNPGIMNEIYARQSVHKKYDFSANIDVLISGVDQTLNQFDMQRYWKDADYQKQTESFTGDAKRDYQSNIQAQVDRNNLLNIYKNYLQGNELSKDEYQNIINKINSCSSENIKALLSEILKIAEAKIK